MRIAILGTRGIPNHYGGFEYVASRLAEGLVKKGHSVTVYNSAKHPYQKNEWRGVRIIHCTDPEHLMGTAGQFIYDLNCIRHARKKYYDLILMLGYTSSSVWSFLYPKKPVIITNMDGMEWQRTKYNSLTKRFLKYAENLAIRYSDFHIADSRVIKTYLDEKYRINSRYIAYGADLHGTADRYYLEEYAVKPQDYFLLMARMEPENNIEMILEGYCHSVSAIPFIIIGNTGNRFGKYLVNKYKSTPGIFFTGAVFNEEKVQSLITYSRLYFHGHSAGGTNPSLLTAMAARACIAAHDNPYNRSVLQENAVFFADEKEVSRLISNNNYRNESGPANNLEAIKTTFNWPAIVNSYEDYLIKCFQSGKPVK